MKSILMVALAIGALISTALQVMELLTDHSTVWLGWQIPSISAAYIFWGAVGDIPEPFLLRADEVTE